MSAEMYKVGKDFQRLQTETYELEEKVFGLEEKVEALTEELRSQGMRLFDIEGKQIMQELINTGEVQVEVKLPEDTEAEPEQGEG